MPTHHMYSIHDLNLSLYEWAGDSPTLFFVHATGFHARLWDQVIAQLDSTHCLALDLRGHGHSGNNPDSPEWHVFADDIIALADHLHWKQIIGVGHSIGGHALTAAAAARPSLFAQLVLIDPVIMPPENYVGLTDFAHYTAKRRREWASPEEMFDRFKTRPPFAQWHEQVVRDYCQYGLVPNPAGDGYTLACDPSFEAEIYRYGSASNIYPQIATIQIPVTILRGRQRTNEDYTDFSVSPTAPDLAHYFAHGHDVYARQYSHFIPMEAPDWVADQLGMVIADQRSAG